MVKPESDRGGKKVLGSFVTATTENGIFGSIRVPNAFHKKFGESMPLTITLVCKEGHMWLAEYDKEKRRIGGIEEFMKNHKVKQWSIMIFDYAGNSEFSVFIYKNSGLEEHYMYGNSVKCLGSFESALPNESEYIVGKDLVQSEKSHALFHFNGFSKKARYYSRVITDYELFKPRENLILRYDMKDLYQNWVHGGKVNLLFWNKRWEVEIEKVGDMCAFGPSWFKFIDQAGIQKGDLLIMHTEKQSLNDVYVCNFKEEELTVTKPSTDSEEWSFSFFQIMQGAALSTGEIVPPLLVTSNYSRQLRMLRIMVCGEKVSPVHYNRETKVLAGFAEIFEDFNVLNRDTMFVTINNKGQANLRLFREDGVELDYETKCLHTVGFLEHWYIDEHWNEETLIDLDGLRDEEQFVCDSKTDEDYLDSDDADSGGSVNQRPRV